MSNQNPNEPAFCSQCKHVIGIRNNYYAADEWKCGHPFNVIDKGFDLVTGASLREHIKTPKELRYSDTGCARSGEWFEPYEFPTFLDSQRLPSTPKSKSKITADDL